MKERFKVVPSSYLILIKDNKILLLRRFNTDFEDGKYGLVAGHVEDNETFRQALAREAFEESGIRINTSDMDIVHVMHRKGPSDIGVDVFITPQKIDGTPRNTEPHKCDDIGWFDLDNLPGNTIPYIRQAIENIQKNILYSEYGW
ncbi:NUDIX domain-containing protein [archaeon]|nr:NUDIX domain-containing protein [archaeon]